MLHKSKSWLIKYQYLQGLQLRALRHNLRSHDIFDARKSGVGWCPKRGYFVSLKSEEVCLKAFKGWEGIWKEGI